MAATDDHPPATPSDPPHVSVLIDPIIDTVAPVQGRWLDGTFGAGGYARRLLDAGAEMVIGVDRDPSAFKLAEPWRGQYGDRLQLVAGQFSALDTLAATVTDAPLDGVVLDLGVSSMQLDQAERGFSFMRDGPLDMRMGEGGLSAADLVNGADEGRLADILYHYGEERASRRIARAIVARRPFETTLQLAEVIARCLPRPKPGKPGQIHPATRSFQAIRIAVNDEFGELIAGLEAAERALAPGGMLAVVTFHSLEDRVVKRYLQARSAPKAQVNKYARETDADAAPVAQWDLLTRKAIGPTDAEIAANPRARSAKLRVARRTSLPAGGVDRSEMGLPGPASWWKD